MPLASDDGISLNFYVMRKRRRFFRGSLNHIYQRTVNGFNLFYSYEDCLVFYTIFSVCVRSSDVVVLELCLMYDHFHSLIQAETVAQVSEFMDRSTSWFAREFNKHTGRKGRLFKKNFGSAPKADSKKIRSCINYIGNNPVEKKLCKRAEQYRWNFLAFCCEANPFSGRISLNKASLWLRKSVREVDAMADQNLPLKYIQLRRIFKKLSSQEKEQIVDYIIARYSPFDYENLLSFYGSYQKMTAAMESNTGGEYDLKEEYDHDSHVAYDEMIDYLKKRMGDRFSSAIISMSEEEKMRLFSELQHSTSATPRQICKFLHVAWNVSR